MPFRIEPRAQSGLGVTVYDFDVDTVGPGDVDAMKKLIYTEKVVVLARQDLSPRQFVRLGNLFGEPVTYHEPMYHHPDHPEIFVSSNVREGSRQIGVPKTGKFWHSDYQFMPKPFAFTLFHPQVLPPGNRGTYFIDMAKAYERLPEALRNEAAGTTASHSVRKYFKIRPEDVYRPLGEVIAEVEEKTPPVSFPTVIEHPATGERILYLSEGFTVDVDGRRPGLLRDLLEETGQLDPTFSHPGIIQHTYEPGDLVLWDNRTLVHRALHTTTSDATVSHRLTVLDDLPLYSKSW